MYKTLKYINSYQRNKFGEMQYMEASSDVGNNHLKVKQTLANPE
jgi:hypothetical protein